MYLQMKKTPVILAVVMMLLIATTSAGFASANQATYEITITNLVEEGQPFTPPLVVVHRQPAELFRVGHPASFQLKEIAENGNLGPMLMLLEGNKHIYDFEVAVSGAVPPLMPGESVTVTLTGDEGAKYLSWVSMLICTNDGFTGLNTVRLPKKVGDQVSFYSSAYDAGTEINTEDFADIVPPCQALVGVTSGDTGTGTSNPALAENGVIHHHPGILGIADLIPAIHGWDNPVALTVIKRVD